MNLVAKLALTSDARRLIVKYRRLSKSAHLLASTLPLAVHLACSNSERKGHVESGPGAFAARV